MGRDPLGRGLSGFPRSSPLHHPRAPSGEPRRNFSDQPADAWADRKTGLRGGEGVPLTCRRHPAAVRAWRPQRVIVLASVASTGPLGEQGLLLD